MDEFDPAVLALVRQWLAGEGHGAGVKLGEMKPRYNRTTQTSYTLIGCPHCNAIFGDWFVREAVMKHTCATRRSRDSTSSGPHSGWSQGHWCLPADGVSYCGETAARHAA